MNPRIEKLSAALKSAKETIKNLKEEARTLKANNKEALKTARGGVVAKAKSLTPKKLVKKAAQKSC